jgi:hypothetical protein
MPRLRHTVEQIFAKMPEAEVAWANASQSKWPIYKTLSDPLRSRRKKSTLSGPNRCPKINGQWTSG